jgi:hypothetical protein
MSALNEDEWEIENKTSNLAEAIEALNVEKQRVGAATAADVQSWLDKLHEISAHIDTTSKDDVHTEIAFAFEDLNLCGNCGVSLTSQQCPNRPEYCYQDCACQENGFNRQHP